MSAHAILSPSSAYRWLTCTPSARFEEQIAETESVYAQEGTLAHELAAHLLEARAGIYSGTQNSFNATLSKIKLDVNAFYKAQGKASEFEVMYEYAEAYAAFVMEQAPAIEKAVVMVEQRYDLSKFIPLGFGTTDATVILPKILYITDLKYGAGVLVRAEDNPQLKVYGLGALLAAKAKGYDKIEKVILSIYQPRAGGSSSWEISVADLLKWAEEVVKPQGLLAIAGQGEFKPGAHCGFCKAKTICKAYYNEFAEVKRISDKRVMTDADTAQVLETGETVSAWVDAVKKDVIQRLKDGGKLPGYKLVNGRGKRTFINEDDVVEILLFEGWESYDIYDPKLKALTALEKELGKPKFNQLLGEQIIKIEGAPTLAKDEDSRQAVGASAADEYD